MITAWYYGVPKLQYGQWAALVTTSTNAYGSTGKTGGSTTESSGYSSNYLDYLNMMYYYNSLYGNSGYYNPYYGGYYGGYFGGYYDPYYSYGYGYGYGYGSGYEDTSETTTTVNTEILPYTPLIFEIYIEPEEED